MSNKAKIEFYGDEELLKKLEKAGANVEQEIIKAIQFSARKPSEEMLSFMRKHKRRKVGTLESWTETIKNKKGVINAEFGFSVRKGGLASIFWNYGTPRKAPSAHWFVDNAIDKNIDEIIEAQNVALRNAFKGLL
jgi:hypothetical protein